MLRIKYIRVLFVVLLLLILSSSCSTKRNTFFSRQYHNLTTHYNVYFNAKESFKEGERKVEDNYIENYSYRLPVFREDNSRARKSSYSSMENAKVKAQKAIKLHSITNKPRRRNVKSERYRKFREKSEYNKYVDDCYLLVGKSAFYTKDYKEADKNFDYIRKYYSTDKDLFTEASLWYVRSLVDQEKYSDAGIILKDASESAQEECPYLYYKVKADYNIKTGDLQEATADLQNLIANTGKKREKLRYRFILAQLHAEMGNTDTALNIFRSIADSRTSFQMSFNASVNMALNYKGQEGAEIRKDLYKLLQKKAYGEYKGQIYYALGNMEFKAGNSEQGVKYIKKSTVYSRNNTAQKYLSYRVLGDYYYSRKEYSQAFVAYDSCMYFKAADIPAESSVLLRRNNLADLVKNIEKINRQDSLQTLAEMSEEERNTVIDKIINEIKQKEEELRQERINSSQDRSFYVQNNAYGVIGNTVSTPEWYFYNPVSISMGRSAFIRKWGNRSNTDNWRRKNKGMTETLSEFRENEEYEEKENKQDITSRDYYIREIPLTDSMRRKSDSLITDGLFAVATILKDRLNDDEAALEKYQRLIAEYPQNRYMVYACYNASLAAQNLGDYNKYEKYKKELLEKFPKSRFAMILKDKGYLSDYRDGVKNAETVYAKAYKLFSGGDYSGALRLIEGIVKDFPESDLAVRAKILAALSMAMQGDMYGAENMMENINKEVLKGDLKAFADNLSKKLKYGSVVGEINTTGGGAKDSIDNKDIKAFQIGNSRDIYDFTDRGEFVVVLALDSDMQELQRVRFVISRIAEDVIKTGFVQINKEHIGTGKVMFSMKGIRNLTEAKNLFTALAHSHDLQELLGKKFYSLFYISKVNYRVLQLNQDLDIYIKFFVENYLKDVRNARFMTGETEGTEHLFKKDMNANHSFILLYPTNKLKRERVERLVRDYDADYSVEIDSYDEKYDILVVNNTGNRVAALTYLSGFEDYLLQNDKEAQKLCTSTVITEDNYGVLYLGKYIREYMVFFDNNYGYDDFEKENVKTNKRVKDGKFIYAEDSSHCFVIIFPDRINSDRLLKRFDKYNISGLKTKISSFGESQNSLTVEVFAGKKQAMMYLRAVATNRKLFRELADTEYRNFVISNENLRILKERGMVDEYMDFFKKWYLNR